MAVTIRIVVIGFILCFLFRLLSLLKTFPLERSLLFLLKHHNSFRPLLCFSLEQVATPVFTFPCFN